MYQLPSFQPSTRYPSDRRSAPPPVSVYSYEGARDGNPMALSETVMPDLPGPLLERGCCRSLPARLLCLCIAVGKADDDDDDYDVDVDVDVVIGSALEKKAELPMLNP
ncbi:hypothetical protein CDD80_5906 [Ophiocordyceps camponoti-rufipedis]|uniref:Uncharacterized protein n=1 Tax=Ophiocordyceps camponoti-rufipedis TaxID=2004952 RepID=A0A2C5ZAR8_9HYPO|nr:hypothetical protein CDD80_5906 [Ophiocordyceps camponoti-rufipedis]